MFSIEDRNLVCNYVLQLAESDGRVVAGALVGSLALSEGDRWSDLDMTFAVADDYPMMDVLEDWTKDIEQEFKAAQLFDLPSEASIYRVFLIPNCLQFDLSFTPAAKFGASGPKFKLLFGKSLEKPFPQPPEARQLFGHAVHHALRARLCIERGRYWQAEYWISSTRDYGLQLACLRRDLATAHGRGFDQLPATMHEAFSGSFAGHLTRDELMRALTNVIEELFLEIDGAQELASQVKPQLLELTREWDT